MILNEDDVRESMINVFERVVECVMERVMERATERSARDAHSVRRYHSAPGQ